MASKQAEEQGQRRTDYVQVDLMKAAAIALVILDHSITHELRSTLFPYFWELTSIPLFLVIMGFNAGNSFRFRQTEAREVFYSRSYLVKKFDRYLKPFLIIYVVGLALVALSIPLGIQIVSSEEFLPFSGPGMWFVPVALTSIIVLPALYRLFVWKPSAAVVLCFLTDLLQHIALYGLTGSVPSESLTTDLIRFFFLTSITIYLFPVALGFWFSQNHGPVERHNLYLYPVFALSFAYVALYTFFGFRVFFIPEVGFEYNLFVMPYSAFLFILGMRLLPSRSRNRAVTLLARVGKASYHILMVQIVYFSILYQQIPSLATQGIAADLASILLFYLANFLMCAGAGVLWFEMSSRGEVAKRNATDTIDQEETEERRPYRERTAFI